jgi:hypothetical protein
MTTLPTRLQREAVAPLTHILLSLDILEAGELSDEFRSFLTIIRNNTERLQLLVKSSTAETVSV